MKMLTTPRRTWMPRLDTDFERLFDRFPAMLSAVDEPLGAVDWNPAVDIREESDHFLVLVDVPGVDPKDINITLENNILTISGDRKEEKASENGNYQRTERFHGSFYRRFNLPDAVDSKQVSATARNGVVELTIPRNKHAKASRIAIKT